MIEGGRPLLCSGGVSIAVGDPMSLATLDKTIRKAVRDMDAAGVTIRAAGICPALEDPAQSRHAAWTAGAARNALCGRVPVDALQAVMAA